MSFTTSTWLMWMIVSKTTHYFTRYVTSTSVHPVKFLISLCFCAHLKCVFVQALKEAFEVFCNKGVAGSSSAELLATFCDNILKKGGSEKLSDEAIEETLEKVFFYLLLIWCSFSVATLEFIWFKYSYSGSEVACLYLRQRSVCWILQVSIGTLRK